MPKITEVGYGGTIYNVGDLSEIEGQIGELSDSVDGKVSKINDKIADVSHVDLSSMRVKPSSSETGLYSVVVGGIGPDGVVRSSYTNRARLEVYPDTHKAGRYIAMTDDVYTIDRVGLYYATSGSAPFAKFVVNTDDNNLGSHPVCIPKTESAWNVFTVSFLKTGDPDHIMTNEDLQAISEKFRLYDAEPVTDHLDNLDERTKGVVYTFEDLEYPWQFQKLYPESSIYMYEANPGHYMAKDIHPYPGQTIWISAPSKFSSLPVYVSVYAYNEDYSRKARYVLRSDNASDMVDIARMEDWVKHAYLQVGNASTTVTSAPGLEMYVSHKCTDEPEDDGFYYNPIVFENGQINGDQLNISWAVSNDTRDTSNLFRVNAGDIIYCDDDDYIIRVFTFSSWTDKEHFTCNSRSYDREGKYHIVKQSGWAMIQIMRVDGAVISFFERQTMNAKICGVRKRYDGDIDMVLHMPPTSTEYFSLFESEISSQYYEKTLLTNEESPEHLPLYLYRLTIGDQYIDGYDYVIDTGDLRQRKKVLITGSVHGNEKMSSTAILGFVKTLINNPKYSWMLGKYQFYIVPIVNPWGYSHHIEIDGNPQYYNESDKYTGPNGQFTGHLNTSEVHPGIRPNYLGYNIGRDFTDVDMNIQIRSDLPVVTYGFRTNEAIAIRNLMSAQNFDLVIDVHQHVYDRVLNSTSSNPSYGPERRFCGMASIQRQVSASNPDGKTDDSNRAIAEACDVTDAFLEQYVGRPLEFENLPLSFVWKRVEDGGASPVIKNYASGNAYDGKINTLHQHDIHAYYAMTIETSQHCQSLAWSRNAPYNVFTMLYATAFVTNIVNSMLNEYLSHIHDPQDPIPIPDVVNELVRNSSRTPVTVNGTTSKYWNCTTNVAVLTDINNANFRAFDPVPVTEGEIYTVNTKIGTTHLAYPWLITDDNYVILASSGDQANQPLKQYYIVVPEGGTKLLITSASVSDPVLRKFDWAKSVNITNCLRYRRNLEALGYTSLEQCTEVGWYGAGSAHTSTVTDLPDGWISSNGLTLLVLPFTFYAGTTGTTDGLHTQILYDTEGLTYMRQVYVYSGAGPTAWRLISGSGNAGLLRGKYVAIVGDSISTNGNSGTNPNVPEIEITEADVGVQLHAFLTYYDTHDYTNNTWVEKTLTIGNDTFDSSMIGQDIYFTPAAADVGKKVGLPRNYNPNSTTVWWEVAQEKLGFKPIPVCWSGADVTSKRGEQDDHKTSYAWHGAQIRKCGIRTPGTMTRNSPSAIIVYRGTNDFSHSPYTVLTDNYFSGANWQYPTTDNLGNNQYGFKEGLCLTVKRLRENYPNSKIFLCTLNVFKRVNCDHFPTNNGLNTLPEYNNAIREVADYLGCGLIEFDKCGITFENCYSQGFITDDVTNPTHPSDKGHKAMGQKAIADLLSQYSSLL